MHWLLKIIRCEWGHQAAVPPSGSDFQKQMCIVVHKKNCVCGGIVKITTVGEKFIQCLNGKALTHVLS